MNEQHITASEFTMLIVAGLILPLIITIGVQLKIYSSHQVPKLGWLISSIVMLVVAPVLGVFVWSAIPSVTVIWQRFIFSFQPNAITSFLGFVPIAPMLVAVVLVSIPITLWQLKRQKNA